MGVGNSSGMVLGREICPVLLDVFGVSQVFGVDLLGYIVTLGRVIEMKSGKIGKGRRTLLLE